MNNEIAIESLKNLIKIQETQLELLDEIEQSENGLAEFESKIGDLESHRCIIKDGLLIWKEMLEGLSDE
jgi:hypothetical protein